MYPVRAVLQPCWLLDWYNYIHTVRHYQSFLKDFVNLILKHSQKVSIFCIHNRVSLTNVEPTFGPALLWKYIFPKFPRLFQFGPNDISISIQDHEQAIVDHVGAMSGLPPTKRFEIFKTSSTWLKGHV